MATNVYFNPFPTSQITNEQLLVEDLVIEAMQMYGMDVYYLPRGTRDQVDYLYGEDTLKQYTTAYPIEMYMENITGMSGEQDFISKFGLEIRDEVSMLVSRRRWKATVPGIRPNEGDLVYIPLVKNLFEITYVEHENDQAMFYTLGRGRGGNVYLYGLKMKQYVFSNEIVQVGVSEIDDQMRDYYPKTKFVFPSAGSGTFQMDEIVYQGANLAYATAQALVHTVNANSDMTVYRTIGTFTSGTVKGNTSNAIWTINIASYTAYMNTAFEDVIDNTRIETESDGIIDFTEVNPFGEP